MFKFLEKALDAALENAGKFAQMAAGLHQRKKPQGLRKYDIVSQSYGGCLSGKVDKTTGHHEVTKRQITRIRLKDRNKYQLRQGQPVKKVC